MHTTTTIARRIAAGVIAAFALTACNAESGNPQAGDEVVETTDASPADGECDTSKGTLVIGAILPMSGDFAAIGLEARNATELAVDEANDNCAVPGYRLTLQVEDSQAELRDADPDRVDAQLGLSAAEALSAEPEVVAVIGPMFSSVAQNILPILAEQDILLVASSNTLPELTRGEDYVDAPERVHDNYFRLCAPNDVGGAFSANYAIDTAGASNVAFVSDGTAFGVASASGFEQQLLARGGTVVAQEEISPTDTEFADLIANIRSSNPDLVYLGTWDVAAARLSAAFADAGLNVPVYSAHAISELSNRDGNIAASFGAPVHDLDSADAFVAAYEARGFDEEVGTDGVYAYDATNVAIDAIAETIGDDEWAEDMRPELLRNVQDYTGKGATGEIAFDSYGDNAHRLVTVYQATGGHWKAVETGEFDG